MKYIVGIVLGLITGLPQGLDHTESFFKVDTLPHKTVYIIIAFGLIGGTLMGFSLLSQKAKPFGFLSKYIDIYIDLYSYMMVGTLSIGIPIIYKAGLSDIYASALFSGWFFGCAGLGLILAGIAKIVWKAKT